MIVRALLFVTALVASASPPATAQDRRRLPERLHVEGGEVVLPTERCGDWFLVEATIDGEGPYRLVVDTGAEVTVLHEGAAGALAGRSLEGHGRARGSGGGQTAIDRWVRVGSLRVGGFEASGFDLAVMDLHALTHSFGTRVDGVLGYGTFAGGVVTFDFPAGALRVEAAALPPPDGDTVLGVRSPTRPLVPLEVSGRVFPVLLDTGQRAAFVVDALDAMDVVAPPRATGFALGTDGRSLTRSARLDGDVRLGRFTLERPILEDSGHGNRIGLALLRDFVVSFDPLRRRVRLLRPGGDVVTFPPARGLLCGFASREDGWEVLELFERSPLAAVGVAPGDVLVEVNGRTLAAIGCERWTTLAGESSLRLTFRRGEESEVVRVEVATSVE